MSINSIDNKSIVQKEILASFVISSLCAILAINVSAEHYLVLLTSIVLINIMFIFINAYFKKLDRILLVLLIALFPLGQIGRLVFYVGSSRVTVFPSDILIPLIILFWLLRKMGGDLSFKFIKTPLNIPILLFPVVCVISLCFAFSQFEMTKTIIASLYTLRWVLFAGLFFVTVDLFKDSKAISKYIKFVLYIGIIVAILGVLQYVFLRDMRRWAIGLAGGGWDLHRSRLVSTFLDPNFLGGYFVFLLAIVLSFYISVKKNQGNAGLYNVCLFGSILFAGCIALTSSRATFLAFAFVIGAIFIKSFHRMRMFFLKKKVLVILLLCLLAMIAMMPSLIRKLAFSPVVSKIGVVMDDSASARLTTWGCALGLIFNDIKSFLIGIGYNNYAFATGYIVKAGKTGPQNSLLLIWATTGTIGIIVYLGLIWRIVKFCRQISNNQLYSDELRAMAFGYKIGLLALIVHSMFIDTLTYSFIMETMWIMLGLIAAWKYAEIAHLRRNDNV